MGQINLNHLSRLDVLEFVLQTVLNYKPYIAEQMYLNTRTLSIGYVNLVFSKNTIYSNSEIDLNVPPSSFAI